MSIVKLNFMNAFLVQSSSDRIRVHAEGNILRHFLFFTFEWAKYVTLFLASKPVQPSLMCVSKACGQFVKQKLMLSSNLGTTKFMRFDATNLITLCCAT